MSYQGLKTPTLQPKTLKLSHIHLQCCLLVPPGHLRLLIRAHATNRVAIRVKLLRGNLTGSTAVNYSVTLNESAGDRATGAVQRQFKST